MGTELVEAIRGNDAEALAGLQKEQIFTFLQIEARRYEGLNKRYLACMMSERIGRNSVCSEFRDHSKTSDCRVA